MPDPNIDLERIQELLRQHTERTVETAAAIDAINQRRALLEAVHSLKAAGLHQQAEALEKQVSTAPVITVLALPQPTTNGQQANPTALPAPAKKRGRPAQDSASAPPAGSSGSNSSE